MSSKTEFFSVRVIVAHAGSALHDFPKTGSGDNEWSGWDIGDVKAYPNGKVFDEINRRTFSSRTRRTLYIGRRDYFDAAYEFVRSLNVAPFNFSGGSVVICLDKPGQRNLGNNLSLEFMSYLIENLIEIGLEIFPHMREPR